MNELIDEIVDILKDYRQDDDLKIDVDRVSNWISQFDEKDKVFILNELLCIFKSKYVNKEKGLCFFDKVINSLAFRFGYNDVSEFLSETKFLLLQNKEKSQAVILKEFGRFLELKYNYNKDICNPEKIVNYVYLDDVLCTGKTLYDDLIVWFKNLSDEELLDIKNGKKRIIISYLFLHVQNYDNRIKQLHFQFKSKFNFNFNLKLNVIRYELFLINNYKVCDIVKPIETELSEKAKEYKNRISENAIYNNEEKFFRSATDIQSSDSCFSSMENRNKFENILLDKGIDILNSTNNNNVDNIRALGFSLLSYKDFGFGALCFTWMNIPNNTPLVFWYGGGGFFPLFIKKEKEEVFFNLPIDSSFDLQ